MQFILRRTITSSSRILPATFIRGGTSKGIFLLRSSLPSDESLWPSVFRGIMGSPDPQYKRQLNGMGGGISSLSKIVVVSPPITLPGPNNEREIDVEYLFVQVGIEDGEIDTSGNCGNLSSMVGVFAVDQGLIPPPAPSQYPSSLNDDGKDRMRVRSWNINTQKRVDTTFPIDPSTLLPVLDLPEVEMAGVPGLASKISLEFIDPAGAGTGNLLPSGKPVDTIGLDDSGEKLELSLIDATNPTVFLNYHDLQKALKASTIDFSSHHHLEILENIRQKGAILMGIDPTVQAQPKIALISPSSSDQEDIVIYALSMGVLHKAVPMTVGLCLGVASAVRGSLVERLLNAQTKVRKEREFVVMRHPSGVVQVGAEVSEGGKVKCAKVIRTGRRLMEGMVWY